MVGGVAPQGVAIYFTGCFPRNQTHQPQKCFATAWESARSPNRPLPQEFPPQSTQPIPPTPKMLRDLVGEHPLAQEILFSKPHPPRNPENVSWLRGRVPTRPGDPHPPTQKMFRDCVGERPLAHSPGRYFFAKPQPSPDPENGSRLRGGVSDSRQAPAIGAYSVSGR